MQLPTAEVVLASLHDGDLDLPAERSRRDRYILAEQLLLQRLRGGGDDDPLSGLERRQQIREALADARPGLGDEVPAAGERHLDRVGERRLLGARLELGQGAGKRAAGTEVLVHGPSSVRNRTDVPLPWLR